MYESSELEVWNLTPGLTAVIGPQKIFNVVGSLKSPQNAARLSYRLNDGPERPVFFNPTDKRIGRLETPGEFNIDTIAIDELKAENRLVFGVVHHNGDVSEFPVDFGCTPFTDETPNFHLDLTGIEFAEQVGQVVDGKWAVCQDRNGEPCLELAPGFADYDEIILFGRYNWTTGYEILTRLSVKEWLKPVHIIGVLFKWNEHIQGDGTHLPTTWNTGLGVFRSDTKGLQIQYGINVTVNDGREEGTYLLAEKPYSAWRRRLWQLKYNKRWPAGHFRRMRIPPTTHLFSQLDTGVPYWFRMRVHPDEYALTVWKENTPEPRPQLAVRQPVEWLAQGSVGILAYRALPRIFSFDVRPL